MPIFRSVLFILLLLTAHAGIAAPRAILIMGDSLSAGYGLKSEQAWPALLGRRLAEAHADYSVVNLSVSGETTAGGLSRLAPALRRHTPAVVVIALGANDGLRGLPLAQMRANLDAMVEQSRRAGARVLLVGMRLPPNYGAYAGEFQDSFAGVARQRKVALLPFLLAPVAGDPRLFLPDNLHPTAEAQPAILDHLWPALKPLL